MIISYFGRILEKSFATNFFMIPTQSQARKPIQNPFQEGGTANSMLVENLIWVGWDSPCFVFGGKPLFWRKAKHRYFESRSEEKSASFHPVLPPLTLICNWRCFVEN